MLYQWAQTVVTFTSGIFSEVTGKGGRNENSNYWYKQKVIGEKVFKLLGDLLSRVTDFSDKFEQVSYAEKAAKRKAKKPKKSQVAGKD